MKSVFIISVICLVSFISFTQGMTIHLLDIAAQQTSIEDGSLLTRIFFSKNLTRNFPGYYTTELDGSSELNLSQKNTLKENSEENNSRDENEIDEVFDSWSIVWYIASFSGLILFFLIVSCSEWCCRNRIRRQQQQQQQQNPQTTQTATSSQTDMRIIATRSQPEQQPPPSYDLFAPPSYDSLLNTVGVTSVANGGEMKKSDYEVYVVPVHTMTTMVSGAIEHEGVSLTTQLAHGMEEAPPSYAVLNMQPAAPTHDNSARAPMC